MKKKIFSFLAILSIVAIVFSLSKTTVLPWELGTVIDAGCSEDWGENAGVIVDHSAKRVLFFDKEKRIAEVLEHSIFDGNAEFCSQGVVVDDKIYLEMEKYKNSSTYAVKENIEVYSLLGERVGQAAEYENNFYAKGMELFFVDLFCKKEGTLCTSVIRKGSLFLDEFNGAQERVKRTEYEIPENAHMIMTYFDEDEQVVYLLDAYWRLWKLPVEVSQPTYVETFPKGGQVICLGKADGKVQPITELPSEGRYYAYAPRFLLRNLCFWFGIIFLSGMVLFCGGRFFWRLEREQKLHYLKKTAKALVVLLGVGAIVAFYSMTIYKERAKNQEQVTQMMSTCLQSTHRKNIMEYMEDYRRTGVLAQEKVDEVRSILLETSRIAVNYGYPLELSLLTEKDGRMVSLLSTDSTVLLESEISERVDYLSGLREGKHHISEKSVWGEYEAYLTPIFNEKECIGYLVALCEPSIFSEWSIKDMCMLFLDFLMGFVFVYYLYREMLSWKEGIEKRREYRAQGIDYCGLSYARPISTIATAAYCVDLTLNVLIAKDILTGKADNLFVLLSLPLLVRLLAFGVNTVFYPVIVLKMQPKRMLVMSSVLGVVSFLFAAWAVYVKFFWGMLVAIGGVNFLFGLASTYGKSCVVFSPNQEIRRYLNSSVSTGNVSASSLVTLLSGYVATFGENYLIYFVGLLPSLALLFLCLVKFESITLSQTETAESNFLESVRFLKKPYTLLLIGCIMVSLALLDGYRYYVFPLLADFCGYSKMFVNESQIFVKIVCIQVLIMIRGMEVRWNESKLIIFWFIFLGILFGLFLINPNMLLAVLTLLLLYTGIKHVLQCFNILWQNYAKKIKESLLAAQAGITFSQTGFGFLGMSLTGVIFGMGYQIALVLVSGYLFFSAALLYLFGEMGNKD